MIDKEKFEKILSSLDFDKILRDNPEISKEDINRIINKLKDYISEDKKEKCFHIFIDGASRGNPGDSGIGVVIKDENMNTIKEYSEYIGVNTNNSAEYIALIYALKKIKTLKTSKLKIYSDSKLMVNQIKGLYKIKNQKLIELYWEVINLLKRFKLCDIMEIPREDNKRADALANMGIDSKKVDNCDEKFS
jgi:ribonuclease HI